MSNYINRRTLYEPRPHTILCISKMDQAYSISRNTGVVLFSEGEGPPPLTEGIELSDPHEWWFPQGSLFHGNSLS